MTTTSKSTKEKQNKFDFLLDLSRDLGAIEAKIAGSDKIVVEDRVALKCKSGCPSYGHKFICPPFTPTPDEFRKILKEYEYVLIAKFRSEAEAGEDVGRSLLKNLLDPAIDVKLRERAQEFADVWDEDKRRFHLKMLELEKAAFNRGYTLALAFTPGSCTLCPNGCNMKGACAHPSMARYPEHALGVNIKKTLNNIGMSINFPFEKNPEGVGTLLIE
jgi:predicted metal-binding protein